MGAGASVAIDEGEAKNLAGEKWDQKKWDAAVKDDQGKISAADWNSAIVGDLAVETARILSGDEDEDEDEDDGGLGDVQIEGTMAVRTTFYAGSDGNPLAERGDGDDEEEEEEDGGLGEIAVEGLPVARRTMSMGSNGKPLATRKEGDPELEVEAAAK
jgi:hypothetical protein